MTYDLIIGIFIQYFTAQWIHWSGYFCVCMGIYAVSERLVLIARDILAVNPMSNEAGLQTVSILC